MFAVNVVFVALQWALLRSRFHLYSLLQIPLVWVFGVFIDIGMGLAVPPGPYLMRLSASIGGNILMGLGIYMQVKSRTIVQPEEGLALSVVAQHPFPTMKIINDLSIVTLAALTGLVFLHTVFGIREGTLISAVLVGLVAKAADAAAKKLGLVRPSPS